MITIIKRNCISYGQTRAKCRFVFSLPWTDYNSTEYDSINQRDTAILCTNDIYIHILDHSFCNSWIIWSQLSKFMIRLVHILRKLKLHVRNMEHCCMELKCSCIELAWEAHIWGWVSIRISTSKDRTDFWRAAVMAATSYRLLYSPSAVQWALGLPGMARLIHSIFCCRGCNLLHMTDRYDFCLYVQCLWLNISVYDCI
jgi:hypothetical protein